MSYSYLCPSLDHGYADFTGVQGEILGLNISLSIKDFIGKFGEEALTPAHIMAFTQRAWRINRIRANAAAFIFACYHTKEKRRKIVGVFRFGRKDSEGNPVDTFRQSDIEGEENRSIFLAEPCDPADWNRFINHYLPEPKQGETNPVQYFNQPT